MTTNDGYTYRFTLHPIGPFFFGGERTFGQNQTPNEANYNYFVRSNRFPQQTALLGMLRYELLRREGLLPLGPDNQAAATQLIGPASFQADKSHANFGEIRQLSPLFVQLNKQELFVPAAKDQPNQVGKQPLTYAAQEQGKSFRIGWRSLDKQVTVNTQALPELADYDHKKYKPAGLQSIQHPSNVLNWGCAFHEVEQIGITKQQGRGKRDERGFYRRQSFQLQNGWSFCFWAQFGKELDWSTDFVFLGAERSLFRLEVAPADWNQDYLQPTAMYTPGQPLPNTGKVILRSDACVPANLYEHCDFGFTATVDFRYIETKTANRFFKREPTKNPQKRHLLERGSVLHSAQGQLTALVEALTNPAFQQIGYNQFAIIPENL